MKQESNETRGHGQDEGRDTRKERMDRRRRWTRGGEKEDRALEERAARRSRVMGKSGSGRK